MDALIICCDWDTNPPYILERYIFSPKTHGFITIIGKQDAVNCRCCFLGESSLKSQSGGLTVAVIFFQGSNYNNTIVEGDKHLMCLIFFFLPGTYAVFRAELWRGAGRTDRMTDTSPRWMPSLGPVTLLCGSFLFYLICLAVRLWTPSERHTPVHRVVEIH